MTDKSSDPAGNSRSFEGQPDPSAEPPSLSDSFLDELKESDEAWDEEIPQSADDDSSTEDPFSRLLHPSGNPEGSVPIAGRPRRQAESAEVRRRAANARDPWNDKSDAFEVSPTSILEAMLFVGNAENRPLTAKEMSALMRGVSESDISDLVSELNEFYSAANAPFKVRLDGPGYRLELSKEFESCRNRFYREEKPARLSQSVVDVLSLVAYLQPVTRKEIDDKRRKASGAILNQLVRRRLISIEKVVEESRSKRVYRTTDRFLDLFGIDSLEELPRSQSFDSPG